jgi:signal peptidase
MTGRLRMNTSRIVSFLSYLLLAFVTLIIVLHFLFGFQYVVILTDSMKPSINPGDLVVTRPVNPGELHVGDVILYKVRLGNATYRITHRIVAVKTDPSGGHYFVTKGDNRKYPDPWRVYPEQVLGKVVLVVHTVGLVWYYAPAIVLFLFLFVIGSLAYDLALELLGGKRHFPKSRKAHLLSIRRKKLKVHYHR